MTLLAHHVAAIEDRGLHHGLYPARVTKLEGDPKGEQRIQVSLDWLTANDGGDPPTAWAELVTPYADADAGFQILPEIGSTVIVGFLAGQIDRPYVLGATWNGKATAPVPYADANDLRVIQTRSGTRLEFDDTEGAAAVRLTVAGVGGDKHALEFDDAAKTITLTSGSGTTVTIDGSGGVTVDAAFIVTVNTPQLNVDAEMSMFTGDVQCRTLIATAGVVAPSYTIGAGNTW